MERLPEDIKKKERKRKRVSQFCRMCPGVLTDTLQINILFIYLFIFFYNFGNLYVRLF